MRGSCIQVFSGLLGLHFHSGWKIHLGMKPPGCSEVPMGTKCLLAGLGLQMGLCGQVAEFCLRLKDVQGPLLLVAKLVSDLRHHFWVQMPICQVYTQFW